MDTEMPRGGAVEEEVPREIVVEPGEAPETVDLNAATAEQLQAISGIGPELASRILEHRERTGGFLSKDEILAVTGIGPVLYDRIAGQLSVAPPEGEFEEGAEAAVLVMEVPEGLEAVPDEPEALAEAFEAVPEQLTAEPESEPALEARAEVSPPRERDSGTQRAWLWSPLLGALLGVIGTLLILSAINGSPNLSQTPVILGINSRMDGLTADVSGVQGHLADVQQRLELLETLPGRMEALEGAVGELGAAVEDLGKRTDALGRQMGALEESLAAAEKRTAQLEEDTAALRERADIVEGFFQRLQSLLAEVFGPTPSPPE